MCVCTCVRVLASPHLLELSRGKQPEKTFARACHHHATGTTHALKLFATGGVHRRTRTVAETGSEQRERGVHVSACGGQSDISTRAKRGDGPAAERGEQWRGRVRGSMCEAVEEENWKLARGRGWGGHGRHSYDFAGPLIVLLMSPTPPRQSMAIGVCVCLFFVSCWFVFIRVDVGTQCVSFHCPETRADKQRRNNRQTTDKQHQWMQSNSSSLVVAVSWGDVQHASLPGLFQRFFSNSVTSPSSPSGMVGGIDGCANTNEENVRGARFG